MYTINDITQGTGLDIAGATATLCRDGIAVGTIIDHGDGGELSVEGISPEERNALDDHARKTHASTDGFLDDLISTTVNGGTDPEPTDPTRTVRVVVLAGDADGAPAFVLRTLNVTSDQYENGEHYDLAMAAAAEEGYEAPMAAFDEHDNAALHADVLARFMKHPDPTASRPEVGAAIDTVPHAQRIRTLRVAVLASGADGVPTFTWTRFTLTNEQYENGEHYDLAKAGADRDGYEAPMVAFDEFDTAAHQCDHLARWFKHPAQG